MSKKPAAKAVEYRIVWKREGLGRRQRSYVTRENAERFILLFGPEPWQAYGAKADDRVCCEGVDCGCRGITQRQEAEQRGKGMPALEYVRLEGREVGPWGLVEKKD